MCMNAKDKKKVKTVVCCLVEFLLFAAIVFVFCWPFKVEGVSMEDTFVTGDRVMISRAMVFLGHCTRGDFVVCKVPLYGKEEYIIKRLVGLPHDVVRIEQGFVYINDTLLTEDYVKGGYTPGHVERTLGDDEYFLMGDNRAKSYDSRVIGPIKEDQLVGKVIFQFPWFKNDFVGR